MAEPSLAIIELYHSLQGESTFTGAPCIFVRTAGCNLRCVWCDSTYTFGKGEVRPLSALLAEIEALGPGLVEVTGGEPLLQPAVIPLMEALLARGRTVLLETSGSLDISPVPEGVHRIVDLKAPGSGESEKNRWENLSLLGPRDEVKIVLAGRDDYLWARDLEAEHGLAARCQALLLAPAAGLLAPEVLAAWILEDALPARLNLQLHRILWPGRDRGV